MAAVPPGPYYAPGPPAPQPVNAAGLVGFILSMCGLACGILFPVGFIVSLFGLRRPPKGFAIAGTVIGAVGSVIWGIVAAVYGTVLVAYIGCCMSFGAAMKPVVETESALTEARSKIEDYDFENDKYPSEAEGNALIQGITDYWETQLRYEPSGDGYVIRSAGADKTFDTPDDMTKHDWSYDSEIDSQKWERDFQKQMEDAAKKNKNDGFTIPDVPITPGPLEPPDSSDLPDKAAPAPGDPRDEKDKTVP